MAQNYAEAQDEILAHVKAAWEGQTSAPLEYDNIDSQRPESVTTFGRATVRFRDGDIAALGTGMHRITGFIFVQVFVPHGDGKSGAYAIAQALVDALRVPGQVNNIWFRRPGAEDIGSDGTYYQVNVKAEFTFDITQ